MQVVPMVALLAATAMAAPAHAAVSRDPSREDLQQLLLDTQDLPEATGKTWRAGALVTTGPTGPAGTTESSGCAALDNAVLAQNTGLTDSGVQAFYAESGDFLEQTVVYDPAASEHLRELSGAIMQCPAMKFSDGPAVTLKPFDLGPAVAGFRSFVGDQSQSAVLLAQHGDHIVEFVMSDGGYTDAQLQSLLRAAFAQIDHPN
ncbi:hypothetical protein Rhe02_72240 [Rhizocola hellebori]|uniref:Uncharacterized protein n=2 Tax=Rhizocola hellebori TaxID=1392758 RepID=A0A8J3QGE3_9ACTN|nr:hypothetical protein Rhe02_72240 [Rhizocola hellebori]